MKTKVSAMLVVLALVVVFIVAGVGTRPVLAGHVSFGDTLTSDTKLDSDLSGFGTALFIGADGVTVDLNGHTLTSLDGLGIGVDNSAGFDDLKVKNGVIAGFEEAIRVEGASGIVIRDVTVDGLSGSGTIPGGFGFNGAIDIKNSEDVKIEDVSISGVPNFVPSGPGPDAILLESVDGAEVKNVNIDGGFVGIDYMICGDPSLTPSCPPLDLQPPTNASVTGSTIANNVLGIVVWKSNEAVIEDNVISGASSTGIRIGLDTLTPTGTRIHGNEIVECRVGIQTLSFPASPGPALPIFDVEITENYVHDSTIQGMSLVNLQDCEVSENTVTDNGLFGIRLFITASGNEISENTVSGNGILGIQLRRTPIAPGPTGNLVSENTALENGVFDLIHDTSSSPNTWEENCFVTSLGADIGAPDCDSDSDSD